MGPRKSVQAMMTMMEEATRPMMGPRPLMEVEKVSERMPSDPAEKTTVPGGEVPVPGRDEGVDDGEEAGPHKVPNKEEEVDELSVPPVEALHARHEEGKESDRRRNAGEEEGVDLPGVAPPHRRSLPGAHGGEEDEGRGDHSH